MVMSVLKKFAVFGCIVIAVATAYGFVYEHKNDEGFEYVGIGMVLLVIAASLGFYLVPAETFTSVCIALGTVAIANLMQNLDAVGSVLLFVVFFFIYLVILSVGVALVKRAAKKRQEASSPQ